MKKYTYHLLKSPSVHCCRRMKEIAVSPSFMMNGERMKYLQILFRASGKLHSLSLSPAICSIAKFHISQMTGIPLYCVFFFLYHIMRYFYLNRFSLCSTSIYTMIIFFHSNSHGIHLFGWAREHCCCDVTV